ncbi:MAG: hypothetical protein M1503_05960 [Thaumarchaeota archaeon]|nr:hypothetical protein [Nitrososphaerota archaeon]MCL5317789.1 hypothetical protein [Nitrososphaerota archaeon]
MRLEQATITRNLGLILQFNGLIFTVPAAFAILANEEPQAVAILLAAFISLGLGFIFSNFKGEGKLDYGSLSVLVVLSFIILGAIGSIPYLYLHQQLFPDQSIIAKITSSYFESISAITTTGLTVFGDPALLPRSLILYRAITQWFGGIGIVFFILLFLNSPSAYSRALDAFGGFARLAPSSRGTFIHVMRIYAMYTGLFILLLATLGFMNPFAAVVITLTGLSTGGMAHTANLGGELTPTAFWLVVTLMIVGATSFPIHERLWRKKMGGTFSTEFKLFLFYLAFVTLLAVSLANTQNLSDVGGLVFHIVSAASTTGFQLGQLVTLNPIARLILALVMFVGGCSFSTAGGTKFIRMLVAFKSIPWLVKSNVLPSSAVTLVKIGKNLFFEKEIAYVMLTIFTGVVTIMIGSAILTLTGSSFLNSFFESISAFSSTGLSTGITSMTMPDFAKIVLVSEMIMGRVEIIPVLITIRYVYLKLTTANVQPPARLTKSTES